MIKHRGTATIIQNNNKTIDLSSTSSSSLSTSPTHQQQQQTRTLPSTFTSDVSSFKFHPMNIKSKPTTSLYERNNLTTKSLTSSPITRSTRYQQQLQQQQQQQQLVNNSITERALNKLMHSTGSNNSGKIMKRTKQIEIKHHALLQCYNLEEKERYRQLIEQHGSKTNKQQQSVNNKPPTASPTTNIYQNYVKSEPIKVYDDNIIIESSINGGLKKPTHPSLPISNLVSTHYTRRISVNSSFSQQNNNKLPNFLSLEQRITRTNSVTSNTTNGSNLSVIVLKDDSNENKSSSNKHQSSTNNTINGQAPASVPPPPPLSRSLSNNSIVKNRILAPSRKIIRQLNDYEANFTNKLESILEKCNVNRKSINLNLAEEEENQILLSKRQRMEFENKLAKQFSERLQIESNKLSKYYYEEEYPEIDNEFPELSDEQERLITQSFIQYPSDEVLVTAFNIDIKRKDIQTLKGLNWLNDEIINFYMSLICERSKQTNDCLSVYAFSTFFYPKLVKDGYNSLRRWTKKIDIFSYNILLVPVHLGLHWTLAVIDTSVKEIRYYDSMSGYNNECLKALKCYLKDEHADKKSQPLDVSGWNAFHVQDIPQQMNGSDCGMFTCKYAEHVSRGKTAFTFNQTHMPYYRRRMVWEILNKKLL